MRRVLTFAALAAMLVAPSIAHAFGAIAFNPNQLERIGSSVGLSSQGEADTAARYRCGYPCRILVRVNKMCAAYAYDRRPGGTAWGWGAQPDYRSANLRALQECRSRAGAGNNCYVWSSICDQ